MMNIRCQIQCRKGKKIEAEIPAATGVYIEEGFRIEMMEKEAEGCRYGKIRLNMKNGLFMENANLSMEKPVRVYLPMAERPEKITVSV